MKKKKIIKKKVLRTEVECFQICEGPYYLQSLGCETVFMLVN